ncbi:glycosyltransferase [Paenibacillus sp. sgz500958]|uniref:glycosyltransferase n=1 Tax=Paenibacillus sp. sgz500958 TaxID=3242475 RepID=UPI0036D24D27
MLSMLIAVTLIPEQAAIANAEQVQAKKQECLSPSMVQLQANMRNLWIDHIIWTTNYITSAVADSPDQAQVLARLLKNQQDIGDAVKPYYGEEAGNKLAELLRDHILIAGKIVDAAKKGQQAELAKLNKEWYKNADDIAQFLSSANPNWNKKELQEMLYKHLQLVTDAATASIKQDYAAGIIAFDKGKEHIILLADTLTKGIVKQFPKQFE